MPGAVCSFCAWSRHRFMQKPFDDCSWSKRLPASKRQRSFVRRKGVDGVAESWSSLNPGMSGQCGRWKTG